MIHADPSLVVISKCPGVPAQPDPSGDSSVAELLADEYGEALRVVHRIDRPASGILILARTAETAAALSAQLAAGKMERRYWAIISSAPPKREDVLRHNLRTRAGPNKTYVTRTGGKKAELSYRLVAVSDRYWLLDVELRTGRHHQIRAQLAAVGCPIRGDIKYGASRTVRGGGIGLHAYRVSFVHPASGEMVTYSAPPPDEPLWNALTAELRP